MVAELKQTVPLTIAKTMNKQLAEATANQLIQGLSTGVSNGIAGGLADGLGETVVLIANAGQDIVFDLPALPALPFDAVYTGVEDRDRPLAGAFRLDQNFPNPTSGETAIPYVLGESGHVRLEVYDVLGRLRAVLVDGVQPAGVYQVRFGGGALPNGTYFYRLEAGGEVATRTLSIAR